MNIDTGNLSHSRSNLRSQQSILQSPSLQLLLNNLYIPCSNTSTLHSMQHRLFESTKCIKNNIRQKKLRRTATEKNDKKEEQYYCKENTTPSNIIQSSSDQF